MSLGPNVVQSSQTATKAYKSGTHRFIPPEETLARVEPFRPVMGITRLANVTGLDEVGVPVVMACRPNSRSVSVSQGKGCSLAAAKASALMESVESYHAERIVLPLKLGSYEELRYSHTVIDIDGLPRLSDTRFTPYTPLLWIEGWDLLNDCPTWVPYELVHLNYSLPLPTGHGCFLASSNGLASGNHLIEAICHGISEVVERDATTIWHLQDEGRQEEMRLDLGTVYDRACCDVLEKYRRAGISVGVWETTTDIGIPSFLCRIVQRGSDKLLRPASGMGCHPVREIALLRALVEAAQSRLTFISGARDDMPRHEYEYFLNPEVQKRWRENIQHGVGSRDFHDVPTWNADTFEEDLDWQLRRLMSVGVKQAVTVDLSKPEFRIPVVRIVIPDLESLDSSPKYVLGRRARDQLEKIAA